jgi:3-dehydrotetronate 4-kinase
MTTYFGAIADDFTGATDLAGLLARSGVPVSLRIGVPVEPPKDTAPLEIIALKIRTAPVADAVAEARAALGWLRRAGAQRFFWKYCSTFDSTPEGNIGPVAEALMDDLGTAQTIYCPAFPENGRSIYMGHLFVGEVPLSESPMKDHPLTPMRDSSLMRLLAPQVTRPVGLANRRAVATGGLAARLAFLATEGVAHVVVDAVEDGDLGLIAEACQSMPLMTGGSAVAMPLPGLWQRQGLLPQGHAAPFEAPAGPAVILSGSCSAMTNRQVAACLAGGHPGFRLDPVDLADHGHAAALDWLAAQDPGHADPLRHRRTRGGEGRTRPGWAQPGPGRWWKRRLAAIAVAARDLGVRRFVVAGGETSGAVAKALGIDRLDIGPEIAPGVPWCRAVSAGHPGRHHAEIRELRGGGFFADALDRLDT